MGKIALMLTAVAIAIALVFGLIFWLNTQPIGIVRSKLVIDSANVPPLNREIIDFVESNGGQIAPNYDSVVCTEFVIHVINHFKTLTTKEKQLLRIITDQELTPLIKNESDVVKGVQTALIASGKGYAVDVSNVKPGDFVQFWNLYNGSAYGHCGIVYAVAPGRRITLYSSHPLTNGYGKQTFLWPEKTFFVRLN